MVRVIQENFSGSGDALLIQNSYKETKRVKRVKAPTKINAFITKKLYLSKILLWKIDDCR